MKIWKFEIIIPAKFREDLFYRLNVLPVRVPPLRERRTDIPALVEALGEDMALRGGTAPPELASDALALLSVQAWRGNIRELRNVLEQAAMRSDSQHIETQALEQVLREAGVEQVPMPLGWDDAVGRGGNGGHPLRPLAVQVADLEERAIEAAMTETGGNKVAAAKLLGISRAKLYERLELTDQKSDSV